MEIVRPSYDITPILTVTAEQSAAFARKGRIQLRGVLPTKTAQLVYGSVKALDWRLVLNENGQHIDLHKVQLDALGPEKVKLFKAQATARAATEFQYLYENFPVYDRLKNRTKNDLGFDPVIAAVHAAFSSAAFREQLFTLTGEQVDFCDMQATRYRSGHFLTSHDDGVDGKNRRLAYVLNLSKRWRADWGGQLVFEDALGRDEESLLPLFNALSLFRVPQPHHVSRVLPKAKSSRLSLTGWFRQGG